MTPIKNHILVIVGPTASGKSGLAIELAKKYDGEIISADSRQVYRGMDIGTGKVTRDSTASHPERSEGSRDNNEILRFTQNDGSYISKDTPHHLIDIREPNEDYNVTDFKHDARTAIEDIHSRDKLPIICGGTGFWVQALVDNQTFPEVPPNPKLRAKLSKLSREELFEQLKTLDPNRAATIDAKNPVRLIRAIEIAQAIEQTPITANKSFDEKFFLIAINPPKDILDAKIKKRLDERFDQGMLNEVRTLHDQGVSWERLEAFGLEYRWIARFLQGKIDEGTMRKKLYFEIVHYAKRQLTWLRRWERQGAKIHWIQDVSKVSEYIF